MPAVPDSGVGHHHEGSLSDSEHLARGEPCRDATDEADRGGSDFVNKQM